MFRPKPLARCYKRIFCVGSNSKHLSWTKFNQENKYLFGDLLTKPCQRKIRLKLEKVNSVQFQPSSNLVTCARERKRSYSLHEINPRFHLNQPQNEFVHKFIISKHSFNVDQCSTLLTNNIKHNARYIGVNQTENDKLKHSSYVSINKNKTVVKNSKSLDSVLFKPHWLGFLDLPDFEDRRTVLLPSGKRYFNYRPLLKPKYLSICSCRRYFRNNHGLRISLNERSKQTIRKKLHKNKQLINCKADNYKVNSGQALHTCIKNKGNLAEALSISDRPVLLIKNCLLSINNASSDNLTINRKIRKSSRNTATLTQNNVKRNNIASFYSNKPKTECLKKFYDPLIFLNKLFTENSKYGNVKMSFNKVNKTPEDGFTDKQISHSNYHTNKHLKFDNYKSDYKTIVNKSSPSFYDKYYPRNSVPLNKLRTNKKVKHSFPNINFTPKETGFVTQKHVRFIKKERPYSEVSNRISYSCKTNKINLPLQSNEFDLFVGKLNDKIKTDDLNKVAYTYRDISNNSKRKPIYSYTRNFKSSSSSHINSSELMKNVSDVAFNLLTNRSTIPTNFNSRKSSSSTLHSLNKNTPFNINSCTKNSKSKSFSDLMKEAVVKKVSHKDLFFSFHNINMPKLSDSSEGHSVQQLNRAESLHQLEYKRNNPLKVSSSQKLFARDKRILLYENEKCNSSDNNINKVDVSPFKSAYLNIIKNSNSIEKRVKDFKKTPLHNNKQHSLKMKSNISPNLFVNKNSINMLQKSLRKANEDKRPSAKPFDFTKRMDDIYRSKLKKTVSGGKSSYANCTEEVQRKNTSNALNMLERDFFDIIIAATRLSKNPHNIKKLPKNLPSKKVNDCKNTKNEICNKYPIKISPYISLRDEKNITSLKDVGKHYPPEILTSFPNRSKNKFNFEVKKTISTPLFSTCSNSPKHIENTTQKLDSSSSIHCNSSKGFNLFKTKYEEVYSVENLAYKNSKIESSQSLERRSCNLLTHLIDETRKENSEQMELDNLDEIRWVPKFKTPHKNALKNTQNDSVELKRSRKDPDDNDSQFAKHNKMGLFFNKPEVKIRNRDRNSVCSKKFQLKIPDVPVSVKSNLKMSDILPVKTCSINKKSNTLASNPKILDKILEIANNYVRYERKLAKKDTERLKTDFLVNICNRNFKKKMALPYEKLASTKIHKELGDNSGRKKVCKQTVDPNLVQNNVPASNNDKVKNESVLVTDNKVVLNEESNIKMSKDKETYFNSNVSALYQKKPYNYKVESDDTEITADSMYIYETNTRHSKASPVANSDTFNNTNNNNENDQLHMKAFSNNVYLRDKSVRRNEFHNFSFNDCKKETHQADSIHMSPEQLVSLNVDYKTVFMNRICNAPSHEGSLCNTRTDFEVNEVYKEPQPLSTSLENSAVVKNSKIDDSQNLRNDYNKDYIIKNNKELVSMNEASNAYPDSHTWLSSNKICSSPQSETTKHDCDFHSVKRPDSTGVETKGKELQNALKCNNIAETKTTENICDSQVSNIKDITSNVESTLDKVVGFPLHHKAPTKDLFIPSNNFSACVANKFFLPSTLKPDIRDNDTQKSCECNSSLSQDVKSSTSSFKSRCVEDTINAIGFNCVESKFPDTIKRDKVSNESIPDLVKKTEHNSQQEILDSNTEKTTKRFATSHIASIEKVIGDASAGELQFSAVEKNKLTNVTVPNSIIAMFKEKSFSDIKNASVIEDLTQNVKTDNSTNRVERSVKSNHLTDSLILYSEKLNRGSGLGLDKGDNDRLIDKVVTDCSLRYKNNCLLNDKYQYTNESQLRSTNSTCANDAFDSDCILQSGNLLNDDLINNKESDALSKEIVNNVKKPIGADCEMAENANSFKVVRKKLDKMFNKKDIDQSKLLPNMWDFKKTENVSNDETGNNLCLKRRKFQNIIGDKLSFLEKARLILNKPVESVYKKKISLHDLLIKTNYSSDSTEKAHKKLLVNQDCIHNKINMKIGLSNFGSSALTNTCYNASTNKSDSCINNDLKLDSQFKCMRNKTNSCCQLFTEPLLDKLLPDKETLLHHTNSNLKKYEPIDYSNVVYYSSLISSDGCTNPESVRNETRVENLPEKDFLREEKSVKKRTYFSFSETKLNRLDSVKYISDLGKSKACHNLFNIGNQKNFEKQKAGNMILKTGNRENSNELYVRSNDKSGSCFNKKSGLMSNMTFLNPSTTCSIYNFDGVRNNTKRAQLKSDEEAGLSSVAASKGKSKSLMNYFNEKSNLKLRGSSDYLGVLATETPEHYFVENEKGIKKCDSLFSYFYKSKLNTQTHNDNASKEIDKYNKFLTNTMDNLATQSSASFSNKVTGKKDSKRAVSVLKSNPKETHNHFNDEKSSYFKVTSCDENQKKKYNANKNVSLYSGFVYKNCENFESDKNLFLSNYHNNVLNLKNPSFVSRKKLNNIRCDDKMETPSDMCSNSEEKLLTLKRKKSLTCINSIASSSLSPSSIHKRTDASGDSLYSCKHLKYMKSSTLSTPGSDSICNSGEESTVSTDLYSKLQNFVLKRSNTSESFKSLIQAQLHAFEKNSGEVFDKNRKLNSRPQVDITPDRLIDDDVYRESDFICPTLSVAQRKLEIIHHNNTTNINKIKQLLDLNLSEMSLRLEKVKERVSNLSDRTELIERSPSNDDTSDNVIDKICTLIKCPKTQKPSREFINSIIRQKKRVVSCSSCDRILSKSNTLKHLSKSAPSVAANNCKQTAMFATYGSISVKSNDSLEECETTNYPVPLTLTKNSVNISVSNCVKSNENNNIFQAAEKVETKKVASDGSSSEDIKSRQGCSSPNDTLISDVEHSSESSDNIKSVNQLVEKVRVPINEMREFPLLNSVKTTLLYELPKEGIIMLNSSVLFNKEELRKLPSVTKILNATMSDKAKATLEKWKNLMIREHGEEGFQLLTKAKLKQGTDFHECIKQYLQGTPAKEMAVSQKNMTKLLQSLELVLKNVSGVSVIESHVVHSQLPYRGVIDCVAKYNGKPAVIEWKHSDKKKRFLTWTFDAPIQMSAYLGALNYDENYKIPVDSGMVIVAYTDGSPADVFWMPRDLCQRYWNIWLSRLQQYMLNIKS